MNLESYLSQIVKQAMREVIDESLEELGTEVNALRKENRELKSVISNEKNGAESESKIIRPKELANMLSISISTLYRWESKGELPSKIKLAGNAVGWLRSDIEEWLNNR